MDRNKYRTRVVLAIGMLLFVSFSFYFYQILFAANFQFRKADTYLYIAKGSTFKAVLDSLNKHEIIGDVKSFAFIAKLAGYQDDVRPGRYLIQANRNNVQIVRLLKNGTQAPVKLTFNSIRLKEDLAEKIGDKLAMPYDTLFSYLNNPKVAAHYGFDTANFMSMFIPNTYEVYWDIEPKAFFDKMNNEYKKFWSEARLKKAKDIGFTPAQVSVIASIVEAETNQESEKQRIAGLYINRYNIGMLLQADPTVKFALRDFSIKRIYHGHIKTESPYNTYKYVGLPPGPINLPSISSIDAVLNYEKHKYLYFCASPSRMGFHDFTENYRDHVNNANKYRGYLNTEDIK